MQKDDDEHLENGRVYSKEARELFEQTTGERHFQKLKGMMLDRLKKSGISGEFNALVDREGFWGLVRVGLDNPDACDQIDKKLLDAQMKFNEGNKSPQEIAGSLTRIYDAAQSNVDAINALERCLLVSAMSALCFSDPSIEQEDTQIRMGALSDRLARWPKVKHPQLPEDKALLQKLECDAEFSKALLQAVENGGDVTFWELVLAGVNVPDRTSECAIGDILHEYVAEEISPKVMREEMMLASEWLTVMANDVRPTTKHFQFVAAMAQLFAESGRVEISEHARNESWRRMTPYSLRHEGLHT